MGVKFSSTFSAKRILENQREAIKEVVNRAIQEERTEILSRTQQGKSYDGSNFPKYSDGYAALRAKFGKNTSPVDLRVTGNMLEAISTKVADSVDKVRGEIILPNITGVPLPWAKNPKRVPSALEKARWVGGKRKFFGVSKEFLQRLNKRLREALR